MKPIARKQTFALAPLPRRTTVFVAVAWLVLLLVAFLGGSHQQSADNPVPWWIVVIFATALLPAGLFSMLAHREIHLEGNMLVVAAALIFARKVPVGDLALEKARVLNLDEHTEFKPLLQLGGFDLPGFKAGHYLLRNRTRAFCLLTRQEQVVALPQRNGKWILVSPDKPQLLLDALRSEAA